MSQATRHFGGDLSVFSVGGANFLGMAKNIVVNFEEDTMESRAIKDAWKYPITRIASWSIDLDAVVEDETLSTSLMSLVGSAVAIIVSSAATGAGIKYTGTALVQKGVHTIPDEDQRQTITLMGRGALTLATV